MGLLDEAEHLLADLQAAGMSAGATACGRHRLTAPVSIPDVPTPA
jgi:hypothetical protein